FRAGPEHRRPRTAFHIGVMASDPDRRPLPLGAMAQFSTDFDSDSISTVTQRWKFCDVTATGTITITATDSGRTIDSGANTKDTPPRHETLRGVLQFGFDHDLEPIENEEYRWRYGELELRLIPGTNDGEEGGGKVDHGEGTDNDGRMERAAITAIRTRSRTESTLAKNRSVGRSTELVIEPSDPTMSAFTFTIELRGVQ
ncbi:MAG: hypothetical protein Q4C47_06335, partial [Planctomycetia bacterium]|nr:hypothetical protein [Planctomycetia bacterium]